jgi:hypothetical protein
MKNENRKLRFETFRNILKSTNKKKKNMKIGKANGKIGSSRAFGLLKRREYNVESIMWSLVFFFHLPWGGEDASSGTVFFSIERYIFSPPKRVGVFFSLSITYMFVHSLFVLITLLLYC